MPNVAGLHYVLKGLLSLPKETYSLVEREKWITLLQALPDIPQKVCNGKNVFSPAEIYGEGRTNVENPELYVVYPFSLCNIATKNLQIGIDTYKNRIIKNTNGWTQDGQQAARLGLTDEAKSNLLAKLKNKNPNHRFPVMWGPNYDWTPDQDHGSNLLMTLQEMVMQSYGDVVHLLPAFPENWDVSFKLFTPKNNSITGEYKNGKWVTSPSFEYKTKLKIKKH